MAIDRTFNFGKAAHITEDMLHDFFNSNNVEELDKLNVPTSLSSALVELLNGDLDHVVLRNAIEEMLETTITV